MRNRVLIISFCVGLACIAAATSLAAGDDPPPAGPVTSLDQLRGVSFLSRCGFSHRAPDDPIVAPGRPGASHDHTFIGSRDTNAFSTDATLRAAASTCRRRGETAAYWVPTLLVDGQAILPAAVSVYYRRTTLSDVTAFPPGFRVVAGSSTATTPQPQTVTRWTCGIEAAVAASSEPPACPPGPRTALRLHVMFGQCWDGHNLDSPNHKMHVAYAVEGNCPPSHPVALPQVEVIVRYREFTGSPTLSSGGVYSAHADFINTWDEARLDGLVTDCLNGRRFCGGGG